VSQSATIPISLSICRVLVQMRGYLYLYTHAYLCVSVVCVVVCRPKADGALTSSTCFSRVAIVLCANSLCSLDEERLSTQQHGGNGTNATLSRTKEICELLPLSGRGATVNTTGRKRPTTNSTLSSGRRATVNTTAYKKGRCGDTHTQRKTPPPSIHGHEIPNEKQRKKRNKKSSEDAQGSGGHHNL
jgi:hypothetical protein